MSSTNAASAVSKHLVFVYGTLKSNKHNHGMMSGSDFEGKATIRGTLYASGLPMFRNEGDGIVHGEVYKVSDDLLERLDWFEGYREDKPENSFYKRISVAAEMHGDAQSEAECAVYVYEYNNDCSAYQPVESGVY